MLLLHILLFDKEPYEGFSSNLYQLAQNNYLGSYEDLVKSLDEVDDDMVNFLNVLSPFDVKKMARSIRSPSFGVDFFV